MKEIVFDFLTIGEYFEHMANGFVFEGVKIINPSMDETSRKEVNPFEYYGDKYENYLHEGARLLMDDINTLHGWHDILSLDEFMHQNWYLLSEFEKELINNLLSKFN